MAGERADYSCDLLPYLKTFRDFKDVKYTFSSGKVIYRNRKRASRIASVPGAKVCLLSVSHIVACVIVIIEMQFVCMT